MPRFAGDFQGPCTACDEYVELALGVRTDGPAAALHFAPGGPRNVDLADFELVMMLDDSLDVRFRFACPLCGGWSDGRVTCRAVPLPGDATDR